MKKCLLIGNGLNRCIDSKFSWNNLIQEFAAEYNDSYKQSIPLPLEFERIVNNYLNRQDNEILPKDFYKKAKECIATKIRRLELKEGAPHYNLKELDVDYIITTNYDFLIEKSYDETYTFDKEKNKSTKYFLTQTSHIGHPDVFHAHGCVEKPTTICLGYEHYAGIIERLRSILNGTKNVQDSNTHIYESLINHGYQCVCKDKEYRVSDVWGSKFYSCNLGIIGLGLDVCEQDLWWLLIHRAKLRHSSQAIKNEIIYYDIVDDRHSTIAKTSEQTSKTDNDSAPNGNMRIMSQEDKWELLRSLDVQVEAYYLTEFKDSYVKAYPKIFDDFKKRKWKNP